MAPGGGSRRRCRATVDGLPVCCGEQEQPGARGEHPDEQPERLSGQVHRPVDHQRHNTDDRDVRGQQGHRAHYDDDDDGG